MPKMTVSADGVTPLMVKRVFALCKNAGGTAEFEFSTSSLYSFGDGVFLLNFTF